MSRLQTPPRSRGATPADSLNDLSLEGLEEVLDKFKVRRKQDDNKKKLMQRLDKANLDEKKVQSYALKVLKSEEQKGGESSDTNQDNSQTDRDSEDQRESENRGKGKDTSKNSKGSTRSHGRDVRSSSSGPSPPSGADSSPAEDSENSDLPQKGRRNKRQASKPKSAEDTRKNPLNHEPGKADEGEAETEPDELFERFERLRNPTHKQSKAKGKAEKDKRSTLQGDKESIPLDPAEIEIENANETGKHLPNLSTADKGLQEFIAQLGPVYKAKVKRGVEHLWWFADAILGTETTSDAIQGIVLFAHTDIWDGWWATVKDNPDQVRKWKEFRAYVQSMRKRHTDTVMQSPTLNIQSSTTSPLSSAPATDDENDVYDCKEARRLRKKFHGNGDPKADEMEIEDPDNPGTNVKADIIGRHPTRRNWLALALPSNNPDRMFMSRGHYVDGTKDAYKEAFDRYVQKGSNIILSTATDKKHLDDADPEDFELNMVLFMPWGRYYHTHAYGIPHYNKDRDFMLYSKSLLSSAWGTSAADDVLRDHCEQAKQTMPKSTRTKKIRMKAWKHD